MNVKDFALGAMLVIIITMSLFIWYVLSRPFSVCYTNEEITTCETHSTWWYLINN